MNIQEQIAVMQAFDNGKEIECVDRYEGILQWEPCKIPVWNWKDYTYRIAQPKKWYRVGLFHSDYNGEYVICTENKFHEEEFPNNPFFVQWLTDRVYY